jgi:ABC-type phosphate/phosphonate transport system substrate-binding protein
MGKLFGKQWPAFFVRAFACLALIFCIPCWNAQADEPAKFHLRIGISSRAFVNTPSEDIRVAIRMLSQKVARKTLGSAESRIYDSTQEIERDLKARQVDILALMPEEFIFLRNRVPLEPMAVTAFDSGNTVEILLLVRKESKFTDIGGLRNRAIVMPPKITQYGNMYYIWVETLLLREGIPEMARFFSSVREARTSSQGLLPVFFRNADACVVTSNTYDLACELNPQIGRELKVIARIKGLAGGVIAIRRDLPEERKLRVRQALLTLHEDQEGKQMFVLFQLSRLVPFPPEYLKTTEALLEEHHLKARLMKR